MVELEPVELLDPEPMIMEAKAGSPRAATPRIVANALRATILAERPLPKENSQFLPFILAPTGCFVLPAPENLGISRHSFYIRSPAAESPPSSP